MSFIQINQLKSHYINTTIEKMKILDKYIVKQFFEVFFLGMTIFTGLMFAADPFLKLIKEISNFGMPMHVALMIILLNLPAIIVLAVPMSSLFATIMVLNRLCLDSEITVMKSCGIGLRRISISILVIALFLTGIIFIANETIVPITKEQSKTLALWSLGQKNVPNGKHNFVIKEVDGSARLKRLFFVDKCKNDKLYNIVVVDRSSVKETNISYAKSGKIVPEGWALEKGLSYNIDNGKLVSNTNTLFGMTVVDFGLDFNEEISKKQVKEYNIIALRKFLKDYKKNKNKNKLKDKDFSPEEEENLNVYNVMYYDKFALPATTIALVLIGIPLAITPPRARHNRGILFSILVIFLFYVIRAFAMSLGETGKLEPVLAAWIPNLSVGALGLFLYWKKACRI